MINICSGALVLVLFYLWKNLNSCHETAGLWLAGLLHEC